MVSIGVGEVLSLVGMVSDVVLVVIVVCDMV